MELADLGKAVAEKLDRAVEKKRDANDRSQDHFHPSTLGHCPRKVVLERLEVPKKPHDVRVQRIFDNGHSVHERITQELRDAGILVKEEVPVHIPDHNTSGHTDGIGIIYLAEFGGICFIIEIKSASDKSWNRMAKGDHWNKPGPPLEYIYQVQSYMHQAGLMYTVMIVENKNDQQRLYFTIRRDPELFKNKLLPRIDLVNSHVQSRNLPPRDTDHPKGCFHCKYCDYSAICEEEERLQNNLEPIDLIAIGNRLLGV